MLEMSITRFNTGCQTVALMVNCSCNDAMV